MGSFGQERESLKLSDVNLYSCSSGIDADYKGPT